MRTNNIIASGFGGQGIMAMGQLMAYSGMLEGKHVSWLPSYGPEMRGGSANCSVVVSEEPVGSPVISQATDIIVMNEPSLDKFESFVKPGGNLLINSSLVSKEPTRTDINIYKLPVSDLAKELGNAKVANMIMLGAFLQVSNIVNDETIIKAFTKVYGDAKKKLLPLNKKALALGMDAVKNAGCEGGVCEIFDEATQKYITSSDYSRTPKANMRMGNTDTDPVNYLNDIKKYTEEDDAKIFANEISIVDQALLNEREGIKYYELSARALKYDNSSNTLESLAHQAEEHVEYLEGLKKSIEEDDESIFGKIKSKFESNTEDLKWDHVDPSDAHMALSIFGVGINIKRASIKFYEKAAEKSTVERAKKLYKELAYWENFQLEQLSGQYEVFKTEWWSDQMYSPI